MWDWCYYSFTHQDSKNTRPSYIASKWQNSDSNSDLLILRSELVALSHMALNLLSCLCVAWANTRGPGYKIPLPLWSPGQQGWQPSHLLRWGRAISHCHWSGFLSANKSHHSIVQSSVLPLNSLVSGCLFFIFSFPKRQVRQAAVLTLLELGPRWDD